MADYYLSKGTMLNGRYEIVDVIGSGGFGITYRALDHRLNRFMAIKEFFVPEWMSRLQNETECLYVTQSDIGKEKLENCRQSFLREGKIMDELKDVPYLSRIQEKFSENQTEYIVMKLLGTESLMDRKKKYGKISASELLPMIEQILYALVKMHKKGFIHRDICPNNMVCTEDGDLYLIDFGAATSCNMNSELWTEQIFANSGFEAPEHSSVSAQGPWTDVYSVCASIVYLLTEEGIPDAEIRGKNDIVPSLLRKAGLSLGQQRALLTGLALDYTQRNISAKELRIALCGKKSETPDEWHVLYEAKTDIGQRKVNQDNLTVDGLFSYKGIDFETSGTLICSADELHIAAVCDGVGEEHLGEFASRAAIQALTHFIRQYRESTQLPERLLDDLLDQVNEKIISLSTKIGAAATTFSLLLWKGNHYWCANIGDSQIFLFRKRKLSQLGLVQLTSFVKKMPEKPVNLSDSTVSLSDTQTLMHFLGKEKIAGSQMAAISHGRLEKGDIFVICSDGVTDFVDEASLQKGAKKGIAAIWKNLEEKGNRDNCSAIIVNF